MTKLGLLLLFLPCIASAAIPPDTLGEVAELEAQSDTGVQLVVTEYIEGVRLGMAMTISTQVGQAKPGHVTSSNDLASVIKCLRKNSSVAIYQDIVNAAKIEPDRFVWDWLAEYFVQECNDSMFEVYLKINEWIVADYKAFTNPPE